MNPGGDVRGIGGANSLDASDDIQHLEVLEYIASVTTNQAPIQKHDGQNGAYQRLSRAQ